MEFLNNQVNEWLDQNEQITIKFVNSTIGMFDQNAEYEIVSRQPILTASSIYDVSYDVRLLRRQ